MCNRARTSWEVDKVREEFGGKWLANAPDDPKFKPGELRPNSRNWIMRQDERGPGLDIAVWDVLGGKAKRQGRPYSQTNVRNLKAPQWRNLVTDPGKRCLIPLTEFAEFTPEPIDLGDGKKPLKGEMWFGVTDQPLFAVAGFWQRIDDEKCFAMVTCDANDLVEPIHPKAMVTILHREDHARWLTGGFDDVVELQRPYPADRMTARGPVFPTRHVERAL